ncbi:serine-rich adhesin for platelets [Drosophila subobscura]|uniref:serine-rich adhesin for platelets n=1 Tax=Drosophila subobscura TaxID=7241 RepID=UPI00155B31C9|nr:serine-rich adhesin for platelets [Drosophila subobscura]
MPTMTRMHRHSSSNAVVEETRGRRRDVGAEGEANKENYGVHFMSSPFGNASLIALQDLSNVHGKSPQRRSFSEGSGPRQATPQLAALRCLPRATAVAAVGVPVLEDSQLSSSRMGDTTLDRMLDAIIESARKEVRCKHTTAATTAAAPAAATTVLADCGEWSESSVHEMEVRTPTHLKRQRVVRRKNPHKTANTATRDGQSRSRSQGRRQSATPVQMEHVPSTKRCLSFSSSSSSSSSTSSDLDDDEQLAKRSSMASTTSSSHSSDSQRGSIDLSIVYDAQQRQLNVHVIRCRDLQRSHGTGTGIYAYVKVALAPAQSAQPAMSSGFQRTAVHRHSSRPYFDQRFSFPIPQAEDSANQQLQLAVWHRDRHLKRSEFLGSSTFPLSELLAESHSVSGSYKLQSQSQSQSQACLSSCRSSSSRSSRSSNHEEQQQQEQQQPALAEGSVMATTTATATATPQKSSAAAAAAAAAAMNLDEVISISIDSMAGTTTVGRDECLLQAQQPMKLSKKALHQRDADENLFLRFLELDPPADGNANSTTNATTGGGNSTSSGAGGGAAPSGGAIAAAICNVNANVSNANHLNGASGRRQSTMASGGSGGSAGSGQRPLGRTPFTMTRRLTRTEERGFGFSIVWTHPPRVEKVEAGMSADRCGILPGDYVIFVDKHNVVTMPEADVLNLIRSQGSTLTLEIFRRSGAGATMAIETATTTATVAAASLSTSMGTAGSGTGTGTGTGMAMATGIGMGAGLSLSLGNSNANAITQQQQQQQQQQQSRQQLVLGLEREDLSSNTTNMMSCSLQRTGSSRPAAQPQAQLSNNFSRPATACSGTTSSIEAAKRRLHLPQVTFSKESIVPITDNRRRFLLQLISREQNFTSALHFGVERFVQPLLERKDLISPNDHRTLFQNIDELLRIAEDILEQLCSGDQHQHQQQQQEQEPQMNFASRVYLSKTTAICAAYKKYCNGIKRADCVLVNKSRQTGSEFIAFITEPVVPRKRPDLTMFIHRPLQHFREILKLMQLLASNCHVDTEEHKNFSSVIGELQAAYREITVSSGLMEPLGEGRPLLTLQDLESRMVFTKCKPFTLAVQGRQWIFGGDLSRVEGRSIKPYWTLLFSDIIVFAKVSRDRVLFITEEPVPIANVVDSCFHMRKKTTEFRLTVDPNGRLAESPTGYCAPDLSRTPRRGARRKSLILRAPSLELKAVWQNLLQRQIFLVNAALGSTPLSSPLDSPDVLNTLVPLSDIGMTSASMASMKLPSLDSINLKQQKQQQRNSSHGHGHTGPGAAAAGSHGHGHTHGHAVEQIELLIDEKCRILNKTGTPKSSALHLANWMKGQLDKQQQQARLAAIARSQENITAEDEQLIFNSDSEQDERITYWTRQQLEKRTKELNLAKENGVLSAKPNFGGKRLSGVEELSMSAASDIYSEAEAAAHSQISQSHSTTSDSQITVRSSPIVLDKLAVCRHCHKNCQQSGAGGGGGVGGVNNSSSTPVLLCNSLKVQHSQSSPNRCCKLNGMAGGSGTGTGAGTGTGTSSVTSMSSSTITGELSSKVVASSSRRETGDTESDVAQLITDELSLSQSEATDESVGAIPNSSSSAGDGSKLRILEPQPAAVASVASGATVTPPMANGHCSGGSPKPLPPPRRTRIVAQMCQEPARPRANQQVKAIVTITETARIMRSSERTAHSVGSGGSGSMSGSPAKYAACHCRCTPEDFTHAQLSPDKMEHQTCKLLESPKRTATTTSTSTSTAALTAAQRQEDEQLSLVLIGLAQFAPAAKLCGQEQARPPPALLPQGQSNREDNSTPTIAVVPPTPDAVLTKTSTHVWDNSGGGGGGGAGSPGAEVATSSTTTTTAKQPRQAIIENIPEDSCDESPLDEEPPYRPMTNALRRFGTMSSLEKLPSDDRMDEADELDDDLEPYTSNGHDDSPNNDDDRDGDEDDEDDAASDKALAQNLNELVGCSSSTGAMANGDVLASGAWTNRAGAFVSDKMSFFEESRAFIDKYLGRWSAEDTQEQPQQTATSETDEQMDECTSGATSGEEVWGTPTSGGDNEDNDMQLINSENTHSSPTKSSTSLNDDDDTELMMDELLMAPPMTASTIRGLLPRFYRRRLEPLFEEETESDEEKTQQDSDDIKKGEATTNGHYLEDSAGSSSDEAAQVVPDREEDPEEERLQLEQEATQEHVGYQQQRLQPNLGPRPLRTTMLLPTTAITTQMEPSPPPPPAQRVGALPVVGLSCEYLLDQRPSTRSTPASHTTRLSTMPATISGPGTGSGPGPGAETEKGNSTTMPSSRQPQAPAAAATTGRTTTMASPAPSSTTTTISSGSGTTSFGGRASGRPARFIPPPPPPRRLLLTQTNLSAAPPKTEQPQRKSGATADSGYSAAVGDVASASDPIAIGSRTMPAATTSSSVAVPAPSQKRQSSTIIETCLLGAPRPASATSSATASRIPKPSRASPETPHRQSSPATVGQPAPASTVEQVQPQAATTAEGSGVDQRSGHAAPAPHAGCGLSPRLEMRLALNHDILGDEDLICYEPGPDLTTILGHDLSTFHRLTGRDLLSRSATNRVQPKEAVISYSQQRNSKMDTPTVNRRPRPVSASVQSNHSSSSHGSPRTAGSARAGGDPRSSQRASSPGPWTSSGYAARAVAGSASGADSSIACSSSRGGSKLGDLEILARREKIYCMSQSRSGCQVRETSTTSTTMVATMTGMAMGTGMGMGMASKRDSSLPTQAVAAASLTRTMSTTSMDGADGATSTTTTMTEAFLETEVGKSKRLINFIKRRNSEITASSSSSTPNHSDGALGEQPQPSQTQSQSQTPSQSHSSLLPQGTSQATEAAEMAQMSPRKDNDKPSLNRRLWKQITKRRRTNSVSQIVAG